VANTPKALTSRRPAHPGQCPARASRGERDSAREPDHPDLRASA